MPAQTTDSSSLDHAASRIVERLSPKGEDTPIATTQPEQSPVVETEQVPAAPTEESAESEQVTTDEAEPETPQPQKFPVKVDGAEIEVTLDDLVKSFSFTEHNTRKAQQIAAEKAALEAERKSFQESEVAKVREERSQYAQYLEQFKTALVALHPVEPDWTTLRSQVSADEFAAEVLSWNQTQKRIDAASAEQAKVKAQQEADAQQGFAKYVQEQQAKLEEWIPDWKDPEKSKSLKTALKEFGVKEYGFSEEEFGQVTDARLVRLLHDAREGKLAKAEKPKIANKIEQALATSAPGSRTNAPPKNDLAVAKAALRKSGSEDDAAAAILAKMNARK